MPWMLPFLNTVINNLRVTVLLALFLICGTAFSSNNLINVDEDGVAIHGYDPVAYFVSDRPVPGQMKLKYEWSGAIWLFSSEQNRRKFIANPKKYLPQYGGYCAYAASYGQSADTDPQAWSIVTGKLYLNYMRINFGQQ